MKLLPLLLLIFTTHLFSQKQKKSQTPDTLFCDCHLAKTISVDGLVELGKSFTTGGFGAVKEINVVGKKSKYAFEEEHNTTWYKLVIEDTGKFSFDIIPLNRKDDYDFMLFEATTNGFCDSLLNYPVNPVRSCISRNDEKLRGKTGLNFKFKEAIIQKGIAESYSKPIDVIEGQVFYLVIDNIRDAGMGYKMNMMIAKEVIINGTVKDETKKTLKSEVTLTNYAGDTLVSSKTKKDGSYHFVVPIVKKEAYLLNFYSDSSITHSRSFTLADTVALKSLITVLPKLKKGKKYTVGTINFFPGSVDYLSKAIPALHNLVKLMKKNETLHIRIVGHANGCGFLYEEDCILFTKGRATSIKNFLVLNGIDGNRVEIDGKGGKQTLYDPDKSTPQQQEKNRRVEIFVTEY